MPSISQQDYIIIDVDTYSSVAPQDFSLEVRKALASAIENGTIMDVLLRFKENDIMKSISRVLSFAKQDDGLYYISWMAWESDGFMFGEFNATDEVIPQ